MTFEPIITEVELLSQTCLSIQWFNEYWNAGQAETIIW